MNFRRISVVLTVKLKTTRSNLTSHVNNKKAEDKKGHNLLIPGVITEPPEQLRGQEVLALS